MYFDLAVVGGQHFVKHRDGTVVIATAVPAHSCACDRSVKHVALSVWKSFQGPLCADPEAAQSGFSTSLPFYFTALQSLLLYFP